MQHLSLSLSLSGWLAANVETAVVTRFRTLQGVVPCWLLCQLTAGCSSLLVAMSAALQKPRSWECGFNIQAARFAVVNVG